MPTRQYCVLAAGRVHAVFEAEDVGVALAWAERRYPGLALLLPVAGQDALAVDHHMITPDSEVDGEDVAF
jgi:hypothetical protein